MKKLFLFIFSLCVIISAHVIEIQPDSVMIGDAIVFGGTYSEGATRAEVTLFLDLNENMEYDPGVDLMYFAGELPVPPDEFNRWQMEIIAGEHHDAPFSAPGLWVMTAEDIGGEDIGAVYVLEKVTSTYISGTVTGPGDEPLGGLLINALWGDEFDEIEGRMVVATKEDGTYRVYLPDEAINKMVGLNIRDAGNLYTHLLMPERISIPFESTVENVDFQLIESEYVLKITVVDQNDNLVSGVAVGAFDWDISFERTAVSGNSGEITLSIMPGTFNISGDSWITRDYLLSENIVTVSEEDDTVLVTYRVYTTDQRISGVVNVDHDMWMNYMDLELSVYDEDGLAYHTVANASNDGSFYFNVSSELEDYKIEVYRWGDFSEAVISPDHFENLAPGTDDLVINVESISVISKLNKSIYRGMSLKLHGSQLSIGVGQNLSEGIATIYNVSGRQVMSTAVRGETLSLSVGSLATGVYHLVLREKGRVIASGSFSRIR